MSKFSGSDPPGRIRSTLRVAASTIATPSLLLSTLSFSHSASGIVGGHLGEPLSATKMVFPSAVACTPRGRVPTSTVATRRSVVSSRTLSSRESSLETYTRRPPGVAAASGVAAAVAETSDAWSASLREPVQAAASAAARIRKLFRIEDCLVAVAGLVEPLGLGAPDHAPEVGAVDVRFREVGAGHVRLGEVGLHQVAVAHVGVHQLGSGEVGVGEVDLEQIRA